MSFDTTQIHAFAAVLFAIASILVMPVTAMAMSKSPDGVSTQSSDSADGPACELPPLLEIDDKGRRYRRRLQHPDEYSGNGHSCAKRPAGKDCDS